MFYPLINSETQRNRRIAGGLSKVRRSKDASRKDENEIYTDDVMRKSLIRQEDNIIFSLAERAQYCYNEATYNRKAILMDDFEGSLVDSCSKKPKRFNLSRPLINRHHAPALANVWTFLEGSLDVHPFFPDDLPEPMFPSLQYPQVLHSCANSINLNKLIWSMYFKEFLPRLAKKGDDGNYGSTATCDTICLQVP
ncbi:hypothetical protein R6Q57_005430 [Mikania cordata]